MVSSNLWERQHICSSVRLSAGWSMLLQTACGLSRHLHNVGEKVSLIWRKSLDIRFVWEYQPAAEAQDAGATYHRYLAAKTHGVSGHIMQKYTGWCKGSGVSSSQLQTCI
jgi:hypothetical protein